MCGVELITPFRNYNKIVGKSGEYRCRKCNAPYTSKIRITNNKDKKIKSFISLVEKIGCKTFVTENDYTGYDSPLPILCPVHGEQFLSLDQLNQGCICPECGRKNKGVKSLKEDIIRAVSSKNNNKLLNPDDYIGTSERNMKIQCGSCGNIYVTSIASIKAGHGYCPDCARIFPVKALKLTKGQIIDRCTVDGICYVVNPEDYVSSNKKLKFRCKECGEIYECTLSHYTNGQDRCNKCIKKVSNGEKAIINYLDSHNIIYETEKRFEDCKYIKVLSFDFFVANKRACIEYDGYQHFYTSYHDTSPEDLKVRKIRDNIKNEYCEKNNIKLIRIPFWDFDNIKEILSRELQNEYKLEDIV